MEPLDDRELQQLLREWRAPEAPARLHGRIFDAPPSFWTWLLTGRIRVPVPVFAAIIIAAGVWVAVHTFQTPASSTPPAVRGAMVSLSDFQPASEIQIRVVGDAR